MRTLLRSLLALATALVLAAAPAVSATAFGAGPSADPPDPGVLVQVPAGTTVEVGTGVDAMAGHRVTAFGRVGLPAGTGCSFEVRIAAPDGSTSASSCVGVDQSLAVSSVAASAGRYHVLLVSHLSEDVSATVAVGQVKDASVALNVGVQRSVTTGGGGQGVDFRAYVPAGRPLTIQVGSWEYHTRYAVYDPTGRLVQGSIETGYPDVVLDIPGIAVAGTWHLVAVSPLRRAFTAYATYYLPTPVTGAVTSGATVTTDLTSVGTTGRYTFSATAGQRVTFSWVSSTWTGTRYKHGQAANLQVVAPSGRVEYLGYLVDDAFFASSRFADALLDETGRWTLVIDPVDAVVGQVTWRFGLVDDYTEGVPFGMSTTIRASIFHAGAHFQALFRGQPGQHVRVLITNTEFQRPGLARNHGSGQIRLLDPTGRVKAPLASWSHSAGSGLQTTDAGWVTLDSTGTWTVDVDPNYDLVGGLEFSFRNY